MHMCIWSGSEMMPVKCGGSLSGLDPGWWAESSLGQKSTAPSCLSRGKEGSVGQRHLTWALRRSWVSPDSTVFFQEVPIYHP